MRWLHMHYASEGRIDSFDPRAPTPELYSRWNWHRDTPEATAIEVVQVRWTGEAWLVKIEDLYDHRINPRWVALSWFWESAS